ncbi:hypothetical protein ABEP92_22145 [Priestia aryabhattai]|uniref:hypothetical protein n=1 Tax=Priestia aryabhattai TaxID=412384 RepID=UPI0015F50545|nr:hypothetical protein [Priestia aryabhattai]
MNPRSFNEKWVIFFSIERRGLLRNIASHNSYHLGEIVIMRRLNGAWPPPTGGFPA